MPRLVALVAVLALAALAASPLARPATPPAGLSVEAKASPTGNGFDFRFRSDSGAVSTLTIDPLGTRHSGNATVSSRDGSISLSGTYDRHRRQVVIVARRGGREIGEYSWRVEASLR